MKTISPEVYLLQDILKRVRKENEERLLANEQNYELDSTFTEES